MAFIADKQTLEDLNLIGKFKPQSIYNLFNKVKTPLGERLLDAMFAQPLTDETEINTRSGIFRYFQAQGFYFPVPAKVFIEAENYLGMGTASSVVAVTFNVLRQRAAAVLLRDEQWARWQQGLSSAISMLQALQKFCHALAIAPGAPYYEELSLLKSLLGDRRLADIMAVDAKLPGSLLQFAVADHTLRYTLRDTMENIITNLGKLDVYIAVSEVAKERNFHYARALPKTASLISTTALRHPALDKGVANAVSLSAKENLLFLTGANMAGKSTFMKSFGIAIYLAHMGFPVAAEHMEFSVRDGLYSSINVPDNLSLGYSHFYAEVLRVKTVAQAVSEGKDLVVIFDELFKGTNVKDAHDATLAVTSGFAAYRNCCFIISTHIIEVGTVLEREVQGIQFAYLPTVMQGTIPCYTYRLTEGITSDRHGMMIIVNEGILEMI
jgi:DNA mismatch repair protein MutS